MGWSRPKAGAALDDQPSYKADALESAINEMDINPELNADQKERLRDVMRRQQAAFAYDPGPWVIPTLLP